MTKVTVTYTPPKNTLHVKFKRLSEHATLPTKGTPEAAGWDLYALEDGCVRPASTTVIKTGIAMEIPPGWEAQIRGRSGNSLKGLHVILGTIDSDYRGELGVIVHHVYHGTYGSCRPFNFKKGDRIAQLVFAPVVDVMIEEVDQLNTTVRNEKGFGSTGV